MFFSQEKINQPLDLLTVMADQNFKFDAFFQSALINKTIGQSDFLFETEGFYPATKEQIDALDLSYQQKLAKKNEKTNPEYPFIGGYLIFIAYEYHHLIQPKVNKNHPSQLNANYQPIYLAKVKNALIYEHLNQNIKFICQNQAELKALKRIIQDKNNQQKFKFFQPIKVKNLTNQKKIDDYYLQAVQKAKKHIQRGDIYQANLSALYQYELIGKTEPINIYDSLRKANPAPFCALVNFDHFSIISSSPERLMQLKNGVLSTRPIAGTIGRLNDKNEDKKLIQRLKKSAKDKSEHVMLVDLERNDLSCIAMPHSLQVSKRFVETYQYVHHIVSDIRVKIQADIKLSDIIAAVFPGGSITGCPKFRCMQIIADIEKQARFAYTGSIGYISNDGQMDFNILIRSFFLEENRLDFRVGAGIVTNSKADLELIEIKNKALGLIKALEVVD